MADHPITATQSTPITRASCARALNGIAFLELDSSLAGGRSGNGTSHSSHFRGLILLFQLLVTGDQLRRVPFAPVLYASAERTDFTAPQSWATICPYRGRQL